MAQKTSVQRIKKEKRDRPLEPAPAGITRRGFLTFLGTGSAALAAGSSGVLVGGAKVAAQANSRGNGGAAPAAGRNAVVVSFRAIEPSDADELVLPEGFRYEIIRSSGDPLGGGLTYGDHNDYVAGRGPGAKAGVRAVSDSYTEALVAQDVRKMSDKALGMLKHMRKQILGQPAPYVMVHGAAISIGVKPGGSECHVLVDELLQAGYLQRYPSPSLTAHGLYRLTDLGVSAADEAALIAARRRARIDEERQRSGALPPTATGEAQEGAQRPWWRSWWRKLIGR